MRSRQPTRCNILLAFCKISKIWWLCRFYIRHRYTCIILLKFAHWRFKKAAVLRLLKLPRTLISQFLVHPSMPLPDWISRKAFRVWLHSLGLLLLEDGFFRKKSYDPWYSSMVIADVHIMTAWLSIRLRVYLCASGLGIVLNTMF